MNVANLIDQGRLTRTFSVITGEGVFEVVYDGNGMGYEEVLVDGETARRIPSFWWYVPRFEFSIGSLPAVVRVSVSPLIRISGFSLEIDGISVYTE